MRVKIIKDFEIVPGRVLPVGSVHNMLNEYARLAVDEGYAIDLDGKYVKKVKKVKQQKNDN